MIGYSNMIAILLTAMITFFIASLFGYSVHRLLHQPWAGFLNRKHMTHHLKLYPPTDYLSDKYRRAGKDNTLTIFALAAVPVVLAPIVLGLCGIISWLMVIVSIIVMALMSFLHDYLHDSFHIRNHFLTRAPLIKHLFNRWNELHYLHHVDMTKNYGIFLFHWDKIMGTYKKS